MLAHPALLFTWYGQNDHWSERVLEWEIDAAWERVITVTAPETEYDYECVLCSERVSWHHQIGEWKCVVCGWCDPDPESDKIPWDGVKVNE